MTLAIRLLGPEELADLMLPISNAFGLVLSDERVERIGRIPELDTRIGVFDGDTIVGSGGVFSFDMSTPGGHVPVAGLTLVAVSPTHRRRGVLSSMMRLHFEKARERKQPVAALWATEGSIYGRFGYGIASFAGEISLERMRTRFAAPTAALGRGRLLDENEALALFPAVWEQARAETPGMPSRSPAWWTERRLADLSWARGNAGPLSRVVIEIDGRPEAYALYRFAHQWDRNIPVGALKVIEAVGASMEGTRALWRYLLSMDLVERIEAALLPPDHPLFFLLAEPRRMRFTVIDALWVRVVDVIGALGARRYGAAAPVVLEVKDEWCPWNEGRYRVSQDGVSRVDGPADIALSASELGSVYMGGISFTQLAAAGRVTERAPDAAARADALFRSARAPWCPEIF